MNTDLATTEAAHVATDVLRTLETAWNSADGRAFGSIYTPDATFVTIQGKRISGADSIGRGHAAIFSTIYAGSVNRMELLHAAEIADGVIVAVSENTLVCPGGPLAGQHRAMSTSVLTRRPELGGSWSVAATHNTLERF